MKLIKPRFYDEFICIADRCTDNCCIGWEIDIDPLSLKRFDAVSGEFGERLRAAIRRGEDVCTFAFGEGERCALLREDGLCELILHQGEDSLCDICALHPRFFGWFNGRKEAGLGLCCEEVCRLLFKDTAPMSLVSEDIPEPWEETCSGELLTHLLSARDVLFHAITDRKRPLRDRLCDCSVYVRELQNNLDNGMMSLPKMSGNAFANTEPLPVIEALHTLWRSTESISAEWDTRMTELYDRRAEVADSFCRYLTENAAATWRYEHIAWYFCYRYFLDGVFEGEAVSRFGFAVMSVFAVALFDCLSWLDGGLTEWQRVLNLKLYSKQMEYSEENLMLAYDAVWDDPQLTPEIISACFM